MTAKDKAQWPKGNIGGYVGEWRKKAGKKSEELFHPGRN